MSKIIGNQRINPNDSFQQQRAQTLATTAYPNELLTKRFWDYLHRALRYCSIYKIGCDESTWFNFIKPERELLMPEMGLCISILRGATPIEMDQTLEENLLMLREVVVPLQKIWIELDNKISDPIKRKIDAQLKATQNVPIGKKVFDA